MLAASTAWTGRDLAHGSISSARLLSLTRGLLSGLPPYLLFKPPLKRTAIRQSSLHRTQLVGRLSELLRDLRPLEVAQERRVHDVVVGSNVT